MAIFVFRSARKKVAENVEYLLRKFRKIPFSGFLAEVEYVKSKNPTDGR